MPTLKDAAQMTRGLVELATQLHQELVEGDVEFERMVSLADQVAERADAIAAAFSDVDKTIQARLSANGASRGA